MSSLRRILSTIQDDNHIIFTEDGIMCRSCNRRMILLDESMYECPGCSIIHTHQISIADTNNTDELQTRDASGNVHKSRTRSSDYRSIQIQANKFKLITMNDNWAKETGRDKIHEEILDEAAKLYSSLQTAYYGLRGIKFVRRGNIKDQILASLVYRLLKKKGLVRQRAEIAQIFGLEVTGFSTGESQVQELDKALNLDLISDPAEELIDYATRYLKKLEQLSGQEIYCNKNLQFVIDIVVRAEVIKCGIHCYLYSRVAGAVYMLTLELNLGLKNKIIEASCDCCKKNTFERFRKIVTINERYFKDIFTAFHVCTSIAPIMVRRLPHLKMYISLLVNEHPDIIEYVEYQQLLEEPGVPDDIDFNIDALLKRYGKF